MIFQKFQQIKVLERKSVDNHFRVWYNFFRSCVFGESMDMWMLLYSLGFSLFSILLGVIAFEKNQDKFILYI